MDNISVKIEILNRFQNQNLNFEIEIEIEIKFYKGSISITYFRIEIGDSILKIKF